MSAPVLDITALDLVVEDDENELLYDPAARVRGRTPDYDPLDEAEDKPDGIVRWLQESVGSYLKKKFDEKLHPRWPDGATDPATGEARGGQFMKKGQWFEQGGKKWQIIDTSGGKVHAVEASGDAGKVQHKVFTPKSNAVKGVGRAVPGVKPAKPKTFDRHSSPVVVPYVDPASHNTKLKRPETSKLEAEEWQRFGEDDQEYYDELMDRFGEWNPAQASSMLSKLYQEYDAEIKQFLSSAYGSQYGGSGFWSGGAGAWLNLAFILEDSYGNKGSLKEKWAKYQRVKVAMDEMNELVHWDLYNRTRAPDIALMHGGEGNKAGATYETDFLTGKVPVYAGFSQSHKLGGASNWGQKILMTPTAIRHVALSQYTILPGYEGMSGEQELAVGVRMKLDDRSITFNASSMGTSGEASGAILKWLNGITMNQPAPGHVVQDIKDVWAGKGSIPIPPPPPNKVEVGKTANQQYDQLPDDIAKKAGAMAHKLDYKVAEGDTITEEGSEGILESMGLKPGDFIEGLQGTRYIIIEDLSDPTAQLRYVKIDPASKLPSYPKSYPFQASAGNKFRRLDGHIDIPKKKKVGFNAYTKAQYDKLAKDEKKPLNDLTPGDLFMHEGEGYKLGAVAGGGSTHADSVDTGKEYTFNGLYQAVPLIPKEGFEPPPEWSEYEPKKGEFVRVSPPGAPSYLAVVESVAGKGATVTVIGGGIVGVSFDILTPWEPPSPKKAETGDFFLKNGIKWTVTTVWKNGTIKAKPPEGHVEKFSPADEDIKGGLFRPGDWKLGVKVKAKEYLPGDMLSGSDKKVRPYLVLGQVGKKVKVMNIETGEISETGINKSWVSLERVDLTVVPEEKKTTPTAKPETLLNYAPTGASKTLGEMKVGDLYLGQGGVGYQKLHEAVEPTDAGAKFGVKVIAEWKDGVLKPEVPGDELQVTSSLISASSASFPMWGPKQIDPSDFDPSLYVEGAGQKLANMPEGTLFQSGTGLPLLLKSKKPKGGATAVALHNGKTIKNLPYEKTYKLLVPKADEQMSYDLLTKGDTLTVGVVLKGDWFEDEANNPYLWQVTKAAEGDQDVQVVSHLGVATTMPQNKEVQFLGDLPDPPESLPVDYAELPDVGDAGFDGYKHPKSGSNVYPKLQMMLKGTYFKDKSGGKWLVKDQTGDLTVLADANGDLYSASPALRGKMSTQALFVDVSDLGSKAAVENEDVYFGPGERGDISLALNYADYMGLAGEVDMDVSGSDTVLYQKAMDALDAWLASTEPGDHIYDHVQKAWDTIQLKGFTPEAAPPKDAAPDPSLPEIPITWADPPKPGTLQPQTVNLKTWATVVNQFVTAGSMEKALDGLSDDDLKKVESYAENTSGMNTLTIAIAEAWERRESEEVLPSTFGDIAKATMFTTDIPGTPHGGSTVPFTPGKKWKSLGHGTLAGWALGESGEKMKFALSHPVQPVKTVRVGKWEPGILDKWPEESFPNEDEIKLKEMPAGSYYGYLDDEHNKPVWKRIDVQGDKFGDLSVTDEDGSNQHPSPTYVPEQIWVSQEGQGPETFADVAVGEQFHAHSATWEKTTESKAKVVAKEKNQMAHVGYESTFGQDDLVAEPLYSSKDSETVPGPELKKGQIAQTVLGHGDEPTTASGAVFEVTSPVGDATGPSPDGVQGKLLRKPTDKGSYLDGINVGDDGVQMGTGYKFKVLDAPPVEDVPGSTSPADPLVPYKSPKGGKFKYDRIGDLGPGSVFTGKGSKTTYTVIGHAGGQVVYQDASGHQYATDPKNRVKAQSNTAISEARLIYSTNGSVRLAA